MESLGPSSPTGTIRKEVRFRTISLCTLSDWDESESGTTSDVDETELITPNHTTYFHAASRKVKRSPQPQPVSRPNVILQDSPRLKKTESSRDRDRGSEPNSADTPMTLLHCLIPFHVEDARRRSIYEANADVQDAGEWTDLEKSSSSEDRVFLPSVPNNDDEDCYLPMPPHIKMQLASMNPFR
jgi:hypothetical protein